MALAAAEKGTLRSVFVITWPARRAATW